MELSEVAPLALGIGVPLIFAVGFFRADRRERIATEQRAASLAAKGVPVRDPTDVSPGEGTFRVRLLGEGERTSIGTSIEKANDLSGTPTLETEAFEVETDGGKRLAIPRGTRLKVNALAGAHRALVDSVTDEKGGVAQRFSFEIDHHTTFLLACKISEPDVGGPFRESATRAEPVGEELVINPKPNLPEHTGGGCLVYPALVAAAILPNVSTDSLGWKVAEWIAWTVLAALGGLGWAASASQSKPVDQSGV